jgi:hypothetical protein
LTSRVEDRCQRAAARVLLPHCRPGPALCALAAAAVVLAATGCRQDMHNQAKYEPLEGSRFFDDHRASRPLVPGTVARGHLDDDPAFFTGTVDGKMVDAFPLVVDRAVLERGHERYEIYCSPCHDYVGTGDGMIVQRGYKRPPSFHIERLREMQVGYFFQVISNGFGVMPSYAVQVPPRDRWAIVAYIRALQLSQHAALSDVPAAERERLEAAHE